MRYLTVRQIAEFIDGEFVGDEEILSKEVFEIKNSQVEISEGDFYFPNSRKFKENQKKEVLIRRYKTAQNAKCLCCVVEKSLIDEVDPPYIAVERLWEAEIEFFSALRPHIKEPIITIGGSVGKTSTKDMVNSVLSQQFKIVKTEDFHNVSAFYHLAFYEMYKGGYDVLVLETAIEGERTHRRDRGVEPDIVALTNIGEPHLSKYKTLENIFAIKSKMLEYMRPTGIAFLWAHDDMLQKATIKKPRTIEWLGGGSSVRNHVSNIRSSGLEGTTCDISYKQIQIPDIYIPVPGKHLVQAALIATAIGIEFGLTPEEIKAGISFFEASRFRSKVYNSDFLTVFEDCYNSSPSSTKAALDVLAECKQRKVFIFGTMHHLGDNEAQYHEEIGEYIVQKNIDLVIYIGKYQEEVRRGINLGAEKKNQQNKCKFAPFDVNVDDDFNSYYDLSDLCNALPSLIQKDDVVLTKASLRAKFDRITPVLLELGEKSTTIPESNQGL